ncbi:MAG: endonuclease/exonuclease/phosphatase family protein [Methanoregulaceae archaeon]|nr:endonuclease/exonuclease/phosphatase family protein [Methanoregulaceae archaeon]
MVPIATELKVMTYNIRYANPADGPDAWDKRRESLIALIKKHDPDLLGIQEGLASQMDDLRQAMRTHAVVGVGRDDGLRKGEYSAIFYRRERLGLREGGTRWISDQPDAPGSKGPETSLPRIFSWGEFFLAEGGRILMVNAHLDHQSAPARLMGARQMRAFVESRASLPAVITGDFNCTFGDAPINHLTEQLAALRPENGPLGTFNGFKPDAVNGSMIDFIFASSHWETVGIEIDRTLTPENRTPSDHFPVIATLRLKL